MAVTRASVSLPSECFLVNDTVISSSNARVSKANPLVARQTFFGGAVQTRRQLLQKQRLSTRATHITRATVAKDAPPKAIEDEVYLEAPPSSLLKGADFDREGMRKRFEEMIRKAQDSICAAIEEVDGTKFREDAWTRPGGGGGISRVMQNGNVWEKAGINVSVVYGTMPPEAYRAATGTAPTNGNGSAGPKPSIPFFAAGISSVMHPWNPHAPTVHFNYRYFEAEAPQGQCGLSGLGGPVLAWESQCNTWSLDMRP